MIYLVSACLLGENCKYNGSNNYDEKVISFCHIAEAQGDSVIPICPELMGGLAAPRSPCEVIGGSGETVLEGKAQVINAEGQDVSKAFVEGARKVLVTALAEKEMRPWEKLAAILKAKSPSCGCDIIYDGTFSHTIKEGDGVTTALLKQNGISVRTEECLLDLTPR